MRIRTILAAVAGLIVVIVAALFIAVWSTDFGRYKDRIADAVQQATGRRLTIDGALHLRLLPRPSLDAHDVGFANASWGSRPQMARLGELDVGIELLPLISGRITISRLVLKNVDLLLETDGKGHANWDFAAHAARAGTRQAAPPESSGMSTIPAFNDIQMENVALAYRDGRTGETSAISVHQLSARTVAGGSLAIKVDAAYRGLPIGFDGTVGAPALLAQPGTPYPLQARATIDGTTAKLDGSVAEPLRGRGLNVSAVVDGHDLGVVAALTGVRLPAEPYHLAATITGDAGGKIAFQGLQASLGASALGGEASVDLGGARPRITAKLTIPNLDLGALPKGSGAPRAGRPERDAPLFARDPLPLPLLQVVDADITIDAAAVKGAGTALDRLSAHVTLENGDLVIKPLSATVSGNPLNGALEVDARQRPAAISLVVNGKQADIGGLLRQFSGEDLLEGKGDLAVNVRGQGNSPHAIAASLSGQASLIMGKGRIKSRYADLIGDDLFREAFAWANGKRDASLRCMVGDFAIKGGIATAGDMLMDTDAVTMKGEGTIDLGNERIDLVLTPRPKQMSLVNLATPIDVSGSLAHPRIEPDKMGLAKNVATGALEVINPLVAIVPLVMDAGGDENPCLAAVRAARKGGQPAARKQGGVAGVVNGVGDKVKGLGRSIGNLFR